MTFGEKLKLLRYEQGLTQDDMGYLLKVTKSCISCYEKGTREPSIKMLIQISNYFRVSVDYLINNGPITNIERVKLTKNDILIINMLKDNPVIYENILKNKSKWLNEAKKIDVE